MSSMQETPAELVSDFKSTYTYNLTFVTAVAWLAWEYIVTLDREISLVWTRKLNGASVIFFMNRYIMLVQFAVQLPLSFSITDEVNTLIADLSLLKLTDNTLLAPTDIMTWFGRCLVLNRVLAVFSVAPYFVWAAFSALRAYAMSNRTWPIAVAVFLLSVASSCYNIYNFSRLVPINLPAPNYCIPTFPGITATFIDQTTLRAAPQGTTATRICLIVADALVIGVTWFRTYRFRKSAAEAKVKTSFLRLLLRDGTVYFVILLILNVLQIVVRFTAQANFITTFEEPLTSILISRFLMNLRAIKYATHLIGSGSGSEVDGISTVGGNTTLSFADRSHFTTNVGAGTDTEMSTGTDSQPHAAGPRSRSLHFVNTFVSPLGEQLEDDDLLFSAASDGGEGSNRRTGEEQDHEEDEIAISNVPVDWANADSSLEDAAQNPTAQ
ncbi:hypothetical protein PYCCODRAFT_1463221 [Trametes coccinea BRFM310]|uniref:DUF6533 domain-containing protein n=1 Tax=Trametes coccinea (strain BRFM310) TaxID=1353009 RepID=A0A1Y2J3J7_TRAC3|nr:hypothetical protein PYCCODRAFT_1463221 [Trametes coccinea BRFM310]